MWTQYAYSLLNRILATPTLRVFNSTWWKAFIRKPEVVSEQLFPTLREYALLRTLRTLSLTNANVRNNNWFLIYQQCNILQLLQQLRIAVYFYRSTEEKRTMSVKALSMIRVSNSGEQCDSKYNWLYTWIEGWLIKYIFIYKFNV